MNTKGIQKGSVIMKKRINSLLKNNHGFSLVELIVVIAILVVLMSQLIPAVVGYVKRAQKISDLNTASQLGAACTAALASAEAQQDFLNCAHNSSSANVAMNGGIGAATTGLDGKRFAVIGYAIVMDVNAQGNLVHKLDRSNYKNMSTNSRSQFIGIKNAQNEGKLFIAKLQEIIGTNSDYKLSYWAPVYPDKTPNGNAQSGRVCDRIMILGDYNSRELSIWAGYPSNENGNPGTEVPVYQLWPNPSTVYTDSGD